MPSCFICSGQVFDHLVPEYRRCRGCGHETLSGEPGQAFMINDALREADVRRESFLDHFQGAVLARFTAGRRRQQLVDIGSGSGKFLLHHGSGFTHRCGVEVSPASVNFSRNTLGLEIVGDVRSVAGEIDAATAWHSLEHFPATALASTLECLRARLSAGGCVIVSVPNAASFQHRLFRQRYAFFDVPNHLHQFTPESLRRLFATHGFAPVAEIVSWPYNAFGYVQALLNCVMPGHNYLYYRLKRAAPRASLARDLAGFCLLPLALPLGAILALVDAVFPRRQAVLTWCFEKRA